MNKRGLTKRIAAILMAIYMMIGNIPVEIFHADETGENIVAFHVTNPEDETIEVTDSTESKLLEQLESVFVSVVENDTITLDTSAPEIYLSNENESIWIGKNKTQETISVRISDDESQVVDAGYYISEQKIELDSEDIVNNGISFESIQSQYELSVDYFDFVSGETVTSEKYYYFYAINEEGLKTVVEQKVSTDNIVPIVSKIVAENTSNFWDSYIIRQEKVTLKVTAEDADAGVKDFYIIVESGREEETITPDSVNGNEATFKLELREYKKYTITAYVTDYTNNRSEDYTKIENVYGNQIEGVIFVDMKAPIITLESTDAVYKKTEDEYYINSSEFEAVFSLKDYSAEDEIDYISGIAKYSATINDNPAFSEVSTSTTEKTALVDEIVVSSGSLLSRSEKNTYEVMFYATDYAGNQGEKKITYYLDKTAPKVVSFESASDIEPKNESDYGYVGNTDMTITVTVSDEASDGISSGVKEVEYYLEDLDGKKVVEEVVEVENGEAKIEVAPDFKGTLHVRAIDNVGLKPDSFESTYAIIAESSQKNQETSSVKFTTKETAYKDSEDHPLYEDATTIDVVVEDTYSGIASIQWKVEAPYNKTEDANGIVQISPDASSGEPMIDAQSNLGESTWSIAQNEKNLATQITGTILVKNDDNNIKVTVIMTDNAGNVTKNQCEISIDKTQPTIDISYDNTTKEGVYTSRTVYINVYDRNFDASKVKVNVSKNGGTTPAISSWTTTENTQNPNKNKHTAKMVFSDDGKYSVTVDVEDKVGLESNSVKSDSFIIDNTAPTVSVSYDNNDVLNENYYNASRTATITITEPNFDENSVIIGGTATFGGASVAFPTISGWSSNGDVHTASILFNQDALFKFDINVTDKAGNTIQHTENEFFVDTTIPEITITGIEDMSANNGVVAPVITITDENYDPSGVNIELIGRNQGQVQVNGSFSDIANGQVFSFADFAQEQDVDDLYTLNVTKTDKAGNMFEDSISFSVNRFGSVYTFSDELAAINGKYVKEAVDVVITETNVDSLDLDTVKVVLVTNGTPSTLVQGEGYTISQTGGGGSWSQYEYKIEKEMFKDDGSYSIAIYSVDNAGNVNENIHESKEAEVFFGIDTVSPIITAINLESGKTYKETEHTAKLSITDNLILGDVIITVNGEPVEYEVNGTDYTFVLSEASKAYTIAVSVADKAGNVATMIFEEVLVTTNAFVRVMNSPVAVVVGAGIACVIVIGCGAFVFMRRKKIVKVKRK